TSSENGDAFTFDWNPDVTLAGSNLGLKLQGVFAETKLHADVAKKLADNADALQKLEDALEFGDDALLSTSLQPHTAGLGRSIEPHRASFQEMLFAVQDDKAAADDEIELVMEALDILSADQPLDGDGKGNRLTDQARIDARVAIVEKAAREFKAERDKISDFAKAFAK